MPLYTYPCTLQKEVRVICMECSVLVVHTNLSFAPTRLGCIKPHRLRQRKLEPRSPSAEFHSTAPRAPGTAPPTLSGPRCRAWRLVIRTETVEPVRLGVPLAAGLGVAGLARSALSNPEVSRRTPLWRRGG